MMSAAPAIERLEIPQYAIDHGAEIHTSLKPLTTARFRLGMFDPPEIVAYAQIPFSPTRKI